MKRKLLKVVAEMQVSPDTPKRAIPSNVDEDKLTTLVGFSSSNIFDVSCLVCESAQEAIQRHSPWTCTLLEACEDREEEKENRWVEMVFWLEWASFEPIIQPLLCGSQQPSYYGSSFRLGTMTAKSCTAEMSLLHFQLTLLLIFQENSGEKSRV